VLVTSCGKLTGIHIEPFLFAYSPAGAHALANLYALLETAQANGWDSGAYLTQVFTRLPHATTVSQVEALLPWNLLSGSVPHR